MNLPLCSRCGKPQATDEDYDTTPEGGGEHLCWAAWGTLCSPVDWHTRALTAEAEVARLRAVIRTGGAAYRLERAAMGIPGGMDPEGQPIRTGEKR